MKDHFWYLLINELNSEINIEEGYVITIIEKKETVIPVNRYNSFIQDIVSRFIGECRTNIEELGQTPSNFNDLNWKLNQYFKSYFEIDFPEGKIEYPLKFRNNINIPELHDDSELFMIVLKSRILTFEMSINFLRHYLPDSAEKGIAKRKRKSLFVSRFRSNISPIQLSEILRIGKRLRFISRDTDQRTFIDIFIGEQSLEKINWIGTVYSLNKFVNSINGCAIDKLTNGKWEIISNLFLVNNEPVNESSLKHPSRGTNDRLDELDMLISAFIEEE